MRSIERDYTIDFLKFFAALLITNSHIKIFEPAYQLSTGGTIGDILFLFCSGFTLFLGRLRRFDNWFKRRLTRIFPPVICWSILATFVFGEERSIHNIVINGGGWFVQCILLYYILAYPIRRYASTRLIWISGVIGLIVCLWFFVMDKESGFMLYGWNYCKWAAFFLFFLQGAYLGNNKSSIACKSHFVSSMLMLLFCIICWYGALYVQKEYDFPIVLQLVSLIPLLGISYYFFQWCRSEKMKMAFESRFLNPIIRGVGGLCFEIYLVQNTLFYFAKIPFHYPYNIVALWILIFVWSYILHVFNNFILQTVREGDYDWRKMIKIF